MAVSFKGLWPACPTLITDDEKLDGPANRAMVRRIRDAGAGGLWLFGSGGEGVALSDEVRRAMVSEILEEVGDSLPILVGCSAESTHRVLERWRPFADLPVAGMFATPPIYYTYTQSELVSFFASLPTATGVPVFVYHNPFFAHTSLTLDSVIELSHTEGIAGAKDSTTLMATTQAIVAKAKPGFALFQGEERLMGLSLLAGAAGQVSVISAAAPEIFVDVVRAAEAKDVDAVNAAQRVVDDFVDGLGLVGPVTNGQFIGAVKRRLRDEGIGMGLLSAPFAN